MRRSMFLLPLLLLASVVSAVAHHGYAEYDRNKPVTLEGAIRNVQWANPHVVITLHTDNQGDYSIEWGSVMQLTRDGMNVAALKAGDRVVVTGAINRNPEKRILTLVREIQRPADGWRWADGRYAPSK